MSEDDFPPLDDELEGMLGGSRALLDVPPDATERLRARLSVKFPPGGGGGAPSSFPRVPLWTLGPVLALGAALGFAGGHATHEGASPGPSPTSVVVTAPVVPAPPPTPSTEAAFSPQPLPASAIPPSAAAPSFAHASNLKAERAILDVARTALGRGDGEHALAATADHQRKFPDGALTEEREAIAVQALLLTNRDAEAEVRVARFRTKYPSSLLLPALEAATRKEAP